MEPLVVVTPTSRHTLAKSSEFILAKPTIFEKQTSQFKIVGNKLIKLQKERDSHLRLKI